MAWTKTAEKAGTYTAQTANKYVDRDIEFIVPAGSLSTSGSVSKTDVNPSIALSDSNVGAKASGKYPISNTATINTTASGTATTSGTAGWITPGVTGSVNATIKGTATASGNLAAIGLKADGSGSATISSITVGTYDSTNKNYPVTGSADISGTASASITSSGYGKTGAETGSGSVTGTASVSATISASSLKSTATSGVTYTENTEVVIPSGGALYIEEGYTTPIKITLDQMLGGKGDTAGIATTDIRSGKIAYDVKGNKLTGNMPDAATPSLAVTDSTSTITPAAISGNTSYYNITTSVAGKTTYGTGGYITTSGLAAATDSSATVGRIIAGGVIRNDTTTGQTRTELGLGEQFKIAKGWYPNDLYYKAKDASSGDEAVLEASGAATGVTTSESATSYYITPNASTLTSGYAAVGSTSAIGSPIYLATTSLTNYVKSSDIYVDGTKDTGTYTAPSNLPTTKPSSGAYLDLEGYGSGTTKKVLTSNGTSKHQYMPIYTGSFSVPS